MKKTKSKLSTVSKTRIKNFYSDKRGVVAVIFGLTVIPVLLAFGLAVDYSVTSDNKAKFDSAADAAALAGAVRAKSYIAENQGRGLPDSVIIAQAIALAQNEAGKLFDVSIAKVVRSHGITRTATVDVKPADRSVTSTLTYNADVELAFGPLVQINDFHVTNTIEAFASLPTYLDIYVVLDNSGSMGIGATDLDISKMEILNPTKDAINKKGCTVACHVDGNTSYSFLKALTGVDKVMMRIDVLRDAMTDMLVQAQSLKTTNDLFQFNLFSFSNTLTPIQTLSTDYTVLNTAISTLDLNDKFGGTNFHYAIGNQLTSILPNTQDGSSSLKRKTHVVIITDGVENNRIKWGSVIDPNFIPWYGNGTPRNDGGPLNNGDELQAFDPSICDGLKAKGAQVTVLDVKYIVPLSAAFSQGADEFDYVASKILPHEATTITGCASGPGNYFSANTPSEIKAAVTSIFNGILRPTRLTH